MADFGANLELIQIYLEGNTKDDIIRLQYLNNQVNAIKYNYVPPIEQKNGKWVVWFYADIKDWTDPTELNEEEISFLRKFGE